MRPYSLVTERGDSEYGFFMKIHLNGEEKQVSEGVTLAGLLEVLQIRPGRVVVELNREIVAREAYGSTFLSESDRVEIVHFVGGG